MTTGRMRITCCIPVSTNINSEYVVIVAFPLQKYLHGHTWMLRYTCIAGSVLRYRQHGEGLQRVALNISNDYLCWVAIEKLYSVLLQPILFRVSITAKLGCEEHTAVSFVKCHLTTVKFIKLNSCPVFEFIIEYVIKQRLEWNHTE
jgi:hypothetical protein